MSTLTVSIVTSRLCACNCGERFTPPPSMPGRQYIRGHKPIALRGKSKTLGVIKTAFETAAKRAIDYRLAMLTLRRELEELDREIDATDDEIDRLRKPLAEAQTRKDRAVDRHLAVETAIATLEALIEGKSIAQLIAGEQTT